MSSTEGDVVDLRDAVAETLARYAVDAFSSIGAGVHACTARFPEDFSENEAKCFRTLADRVLDDVRPKLSRIRTENEALREALTYIANHDNAFLTNDSGATRTCINTLCDIARDALSHGDKT